MLKPSLTPDEAAMRALRALFERRGFLRTTPGKFEDYNLYVENRNFLGCEQFITFMAMDGRLLALKPDATLSIVKNIPDGPLNTFEKLYYLDEVYRPSRESRDFRVCSQIGVELVGPPDPFSNLEIISLALEALALIAPEFVLDISHLGFVSGLLDSVELSPSVKAQVLSAIHAKSAHEIRAILGRAGAAEQDIRCVLSLAELHGPLYKMLPQARELCRSDAMLAACAELTALEAVIGQNGAREQVFLDFSVVSDLDYYNGLVFLGYVHGVPMAVLSGGRYDNLMARMGKQSSAIGFAVNLTELGVYGRGARGCDFGALIRYESGCDWARLLAAQKALAETEGPVRLEPEGSGGGAGWSFQRQYRFTRENLLREVLP